MKRCLSGKTPSKEEVSENNHDIIPTPTQTLSYKTPFKWAPWGNKSQFEKVLDQGTAWETHGKYTEIVGLGQEGWGKGAKRKNQEQEDASVGWNTIEDFWEYRSKAKKGLKE